MTANAKTTHQSGQICVLTSGGSTNLALLWDLSRKYSRVLPIFMQTGLRWEECELYWLKKFMRSGRIKNLEPLEILSLSLRDIYQTHWSLTGVKIPDQGADAREAYVPGRNVLLLTKGALFAATKGIDCLAIGITKNYPFADGETHFFKQLKNIFTKSLETEVNIIAPYINKGKEEVIFDARDMGFEYSFSCLNPRGYQHCGECFKCAERKKSFARSGITDKTHYHRTLQFSHA